MSTNEQARVTHDVASKALDDMDDYARMGAGVDAHGPRGVLERYIAQQSLNAPAGVVSDAMVGAAMLAYVRSAGTVDTPYGDLLPNDYDAMRAALEAARTAPVQGEAVAWRYWIEDDATLNPFWTGWSTDVGFRQLTEKRGYAKVEYAYTALPAPPAERVPDVQAIMAHLPDNRAATRCELIRAFTLAASPAPSESESESESEGEGEGGKGVDRG